MNTRADHIPAPAALSRDALPHRASLPFRGDIEGLRAVAIIAVVACHARVPGFEGGFTGVDIFFVLSGYLITGLLLQEISATGKIAFLDFYTRRLMRLLPALLLMIAATMAAAAIILAPFEQPQQAGAARAAAFWMSNFHFAFAALDYFGADSARNLFLHTWSLGVEEQFYLVWPVFILALCTAAARGRADPQRLFDGFCHALLACLILCAALSYTQPLWGFYLMPSRGWQFALGGLVFLLARQQDPRPLGGDPRLHALVPPLAGATGFGLIVFALTFLDEGMTYPGFWALAPSSGAALILYAGAVSQGPVSRLLALRPMQAIGKVSYSWYLWHWPVLVLGSALVPQAGLTQRLLLAGLALVLAWISFKTVEGPVRRSTAPARRSGLTVMMSIALMAAVFHAGMYWETNARAWSNEPEQLAYQEARATLPVIYGMGCDDWYASARVRFCAFGDAEASRTAVLFGDSIGAQWFPAFAQPFLEQGWRFLVLTKSACPLVDVPIFYERIGMMYTVCSDWRGAAIAELQALKPDVVLMGSAADYDFSEHQWIEGTGSVLQRLANAAGRVYLIPGTYRLPFDGPACLARQAWQPDFLARLGACDAAADDPVDVVVLGALQEAASGYRNVEVLDLNALICPDRRCSARTEGSIVYRDYQHVSAAYMEAIAPRIRQRIPELRQGASE